jgi:Calcineurin-like phosphoesterase
MPGEAEWAMPVATWDFVLPAVYQTSFHPLYPRSLSNRFFCPSSSSKYVPQKLPLTSMPDLIPEILKAIEISSVEIEEAEIPALEKEYMELIGDFLQHSERKIGLERNMQGPEPAIAAQKDSDSSPPRIVLIGDIHCDFTSLKALLMQLHASEYDYFNQGVFIFLGDYMDRGVSAFETLRLLLHLKKILKDRCTLLRGNHEIILLDKDTNEYYSPVRPAETIGFLKEYVTRETIEGIRDFYEALPYYARIIYPETGESGETGETGETVESGKTGKTGETGETGKTGKTWLLVHGGIPKDSNMKDFTPESLQEFTLPLKNKNKEERKARAFLDAMLWSDPRDVDFKMNGNSTRFEFGRSQFDSFAEHFGFTHLVRAHEAKENGYEEMYDGKLHTIFSSGGADNPDSGYSSLVPEPAFGIIDEHGELSYHHVFNNL